MSRPSRVLNVLLGRGLAAAAVMGSALVALPVQAATEATRVVSGGEKENPFDLNVSVAFLSARRQALLKREQVDAAGAATTVRDLVYERQTNIVNLRTDLGLLPNFGLTFNLPFVISDQRVLSFDRSSEDCPGSGCVDASNSTFLRDGILPGAGATSHGLDAGTGQPFSSPSRRVFEGPERRGLAYLGVGLGWAVFNQARVPTDPTWLLGFEARFSLADQKFDPARPNANKNVGPGFHQLVFSTAASRAFGWIEPYLFGFYMLPIEKPGSPYDVPALGENVFDNPQHVAGFDVGVQATLWQSPRSAWAFGVDVRFRNQVHFLGLAQGELWEPLSGGSECQSNPAACRPGLDQRDLDGDGVAEPDPHSGTTRSPSYGVFGGDLAFNLRAGANLRFRLLGGLTAEQSRFLSDGRSGYDLYDAPGRRFRVERARSLYGMFEGGLYF